MLSGREIASTYPRATRPATQSNIVPRIEDVASSGPVENTISPPSLRMLRLRSARPGSNVTVYVVLGFHPARGRTSIASRSHLTATAPVDGEMRNRLWSSPDGD